MQTFKRVCVENYEIEDPDTHETFTVQRAKEYTTSAERPDGSLTVFSRYWVSVPARIFAGEIQLTPPSKPKCPTCGQ